MRSLSIAQGGSEWIRNFGRLQLENLQVSDDVTTSAIEQNCTALRGIKLSMADSDAISLLSGNLWEKIGSTLSSLQLSLTLPGSVEFDNSIKH